MGVRQRDARVSRAERDLRRLEQQSAEKVFTAVFEIANAPPDAGTYSDAWEIASTELDKMIQTGTLIRAAATTI